jgi:hypothetical protein
VPDKPDGFGTIIVAGRYTIIISGRDDPVFTLTGEIRVGVSE